MTTKAKGNKLVCIPLAKLNCQHCGLMSTDNCGGRGDYSLRDPSTYYCIQIWSNFKENGNGKKAN